MKKAIFTLAIGDNPMYRAAIASFRYYADKVGADLIISDQLHFPISIEKPKYNASPAWTEKLRIGDLLREYDRVLYVDADVLITPNARNVFELYTDRETTYWFDEGVVQDRDNDIALVCDALGDVCWPKNNERFVYYNAGIILTSKESGLFEKTKLDDLQRICNEITHYDQSYFNYLLHRHSIKHASLDKAFNRMDMFGSDDYLEADFIHYAGKGYAKNSRRRDVQFLKDFGNLYHNLLPVEQVTNLKIRAWQDYLAVVYKKYPLPNSVIKMFSQRFVPH
ncbi:glycosyltransferase family 8 protein [Pseudoalteromonas aurantia]|uniref:Glycosyl transferase n=1 Tax=Pseudoalteromonas aurantia 208 TaxID=1314867 RepID=A0ABR9E6N9_9GAMM|nr:glycosyltransferase family 8 protein [Pseudoalteromonas aurantia]MBE0366656.1 hypothetical protein [Pseudoalteromonas aurantia 208]